MRREIAAASLIRDKNRSKELETYKTRSTYVTEIKFREMLLRNRASNRENSRLSPVKEDQIDTGS